MVSKQKTIKIFTECFLCLLLALLISLPMFTTLTATAAAAGTIVDADYTDGTYSKSSDGKYYATLANNCGYQGQGVLLYLLERNGGSAVAGTTPKAYACGNTMRSYELHARDKYNRYPEVTHWEGTNPPWAAEAGYNQMGGFLKNSSTYNTAAIKSWLRTPYGEGTLGIRMVQDIWGNDVALRFTNEEIILVAEPIVAVKFAQCTKASILEMDSSTSVEQIRQNLYTFKIVISNDRNTRMSSDLLDFVNDKLSVLQGANRMPTQALNSIKADILSTLSQMTGNVYMYYPLGDVYAGTPKMVAKYYASLTPDTTVYSSNPWLKSDQGRVFYRKAANAASYISTGSVVCANAGFTLWSGGSAGIRQYHSDSNLETYSIGMLAMLAFTEDGVGDYTHTYDTTCGSTPGRAPEYVPTPPTSSLPRSYTIIKAYRHRTSPTLPYVDDGVYTREDTIGKILIEDEPTYTVVDWFTTSSPTATVGLSDATRWNESKSHASIMEQGNASLASPITLPPAQKYLYVLLERTNTSVPPTDANYTLPE